MSHLFLVNNKIWFHYWVSWASLGCSLMLEVGSFECLCHLLCLPRVQWREGLGRRGERHAGRTAILGRFWVYYLRPSRLEWTHAGDSCPGFSSSLVFTPSSPNRWSPGFQGMDPPSSLMCPVLEPYFQSQNFMYPLNLVMLLFALGMYFR